MSNYLFPSASENHRRFLGLYLFAKFNARKRKVSQPEPLPFTNSNLRNLINRMIRSHLLILVLSLSLNTLVAQNSWKAQWIRSFEQQNITNTWTAYQKRFNAAKVPTDAIARIACDSKYWMWINGELVVFEGQLKRGPTPDDTYYDAVNISSYSSLS